MTDKRTITLLGIGAILVVILLGYVGVVAPFVTDVQKTQQEIVTAEEANAQARAQIAELQTVQAQEGEVAKVEERLSNQFPAAADPDSLRNQVYAIAGKNNVDAEVKTDMPSLIQGAGGAAESADASAENTGAGAGAAASPLASMTLSISAEGAQNDVVAFLRDLEDMDRVVVAQNVSLSESDKNYVLDIPAISYLYKGIPSPSETAEAEATAPDATNE